MKKYFIISCACFLMNGCGSSIQSDVDEASLVHSVESINEPGHSTLIGRKMDISVVSAIQQNAQIPDFDKVLFSSKQNYSIRDPYVPSPKQPIIIDGNRIIINQTLFAYDNETKKKQPLFLIWNEDSFSEKILQASFSHSKDDPLNQSTPTPVRTQALYNGDSGVWYFSILDALASEKLEDLSTQDLHWFTLDLLLKDSSHVLMHIGLRLLGVLPKVDFTSNEKNINPYLSNAENLLLKDQYPLLTEQYANKDLKPIKIWVNHEFNEWKYFTTIQKRSYQGFSDQPPQERLNYYKSQVPIGLKYINIKEYSKNSNQFKEYRLANHAPIKLSGETRIEVQWMFGFKEMPKHCQVRAEAQKVYHWKTEHERWIFDPLDHENKPTRKRERYYENHSQTVSEGDMIIGVELLGQLKRGTIVSEFFYDYEKIYLSEMSHKYFNPKSKDNYFLTYLLQSTDYEKSAFTRGQRSNPDHALYGCQGYF